MKIAELLVCSMCSTSVEPYPTIHSWIFGFGIDCPPFPTLVGSFFTIENKNNNNNNKRWGSSVELQRTLNLSIQAPLCPLFLSDPLLLCITRPGLGKIESKFYNFLFLSPFFWEGGGER